MTAPCEWPLLGCDDCDQWTSLSEVLAEAAQRAAVEYLWRWTGQRYGTCEVAIRPCRMDCPPSTMQRPVMVGAATPAGGFWPVQIGGEWFNVTCGSCPGSGCSCTAMSEVRLPGPIASVDAVILDGAILEPWRYRVDDRVRLVRVDGGAWPPCQDMTENTTAPGTFEVRYRRGIPVPTAGQVAAGVLTCEIAKALCGDDSCELPGRVERVDREGVSLVLIDPTSQDGSTGIWLVDSFIGQVRKAPSRPRVVNVDLWLKQRRTTTAPGAGSPS